MKLTLVVGARPNFMKIAPIIKAIRSKQEEGAPINYRLVHTGQHYSASLSQSFLDDLNIPAPDVNLAVGSGSHATQTASVMMKFEDELLANPADEVLVVGDVNSTLAASIVAKKCQTNVAHIEAGLRSGDRTMPEEINRIATDAITDHFFTTTEAAGARLQREGVDASQIFFVGNTMIDSLMAVSSVLEQPNIWQQEALNAGNYFLVTLHRPSNVDDPGHLIDLLQQIGEGCQGLPVIFPVHPRTKKQLEGYSRIPGNIVMTEPTRYLAFIYLLKYAKAVITDSGGIQEETTAMRVPCITLRTSTERPETVEIGSNLLVPDPLTSLQLALDKLFNGQWQKGDVPPKWDGQAGQRILEALLNTIYGK